MFRIRSKMPLINFRKSDGNASFLRAARAGNLDKVLEYLKGSTDINTSNANGLNALHLASKEGHVHVVTELLKRGANVDAATKKGNTALHIASLAGQLEVAKVLVKSNAKVNAQSQNGFTPLYMAAQECHADMVRLLLQHGASQVITTEDGFTPLAVALQQGHDKVVTVLLENDTRGKVRLPALHIAAKKDDTKAAALLLQNDQNADVNSKNSGLVNDTTKSGFTPLHIASHYGNVNVATLLIERGADVNFKARNGICPLHVAAKWGKLNLLNLLVESGAAVDGRTRDGLTPLHCAARSGHEGCVDVLLERGAPIGAKTRNGLMPLHMAAQGDHVDCGRLLLLKKAPVDEVTVDYLTPLHVAAHCGNVRMAKLLLDSKCEPNSRALNGFTPLHIACKKNRIKVVELLLKYGASIEATTESGLTPLHVASFMGHMNIVICLIQNSANPDFQTVRGETALHLAARANQTDIIRILLRNNAQVDARAREQQTPLHIAARLGNQDNVMLLLQHGASPDALTKDLYTPLHIAAKEGQEEVANILMDHGASHNLTTKKGFTPLHISAKYGNIKVARLLLQKGANPDVQGKNGLTPLHVATHYNHVNVAMLLLDRGASPHCSAKNGYTPLHIAAKKNQMDIATSLLKYGAKTNAESKNGFMPIHLASQEGHKDMVVLLLDNGAEANCRAKNMLAPMHLAAQEDREAVAVVLEGHQAELDPTTKAGYTPLHTASHFGQLNMVRYLTKLGSNVNATTKMGYTPLHQAAQQGHVMVCKELLKNGASPNAVTNNGQTALSIADRLGYLSVVDTLSDVTSVSPATTTLPEGEKLQIQSPEMLQETFMTDSEDEGESFAETPSATIERLRKHRNRPHHSQPNKEQHQSHQQQFQYLNANNSLNSQDNSFDTFDGRKDRLNTIDDFSKMMSGSNQQLEREMEYGGRILSDSTIERGDSLTRPYSKSQDTISMGISMSEDTILGDQYTYLQSDDMKYMHDDSIQSQKQEKFEQATVTQVHAGVEMRGGPYSQSQYAQDPAYTMTNTQLNNYEPDNVVEQIPPVFSGFLISFMVDARGGAMRGCRHQGVRIIIPPRKATMPTRVTCRLVKKEKLLHPPPLMEGEGLASRLLEMGPCGTSFLGPVVLEVPHFASLRGKEREVIIMRSDNGETWREHPVEATEEAVQQALGGSFDDLESAEDLYSKRITRILTSDFPQYFALITRVREETNHIGGEGGTISSTVIPQVQAVFPEGALTKKIKVGLQAQQLPSDQVAKLLGNRVAVSPIVTVEPRRRKFHKPITLTIPLPKASQKGMINQYAGDTPTLRLLCSITGGTSPAQWEDLTGTTPLTFHKDCVSFTTAVSARFWLMDCQNINEAAKIATELYRESICVPYMSKFVIFAKRHEPMEARLRCFCMTDDKMEKTLEGQEHYTKVAESRDVEVLEGKPNWIEMVGNLAPVTKSGEQLNLPFRAFRENRLPFNIRIRDTNQELVARVAFMRDPKQQRGEAPQTPICSLNIELSDQIKGEDTDYDPEAAEEMNMKYKLLRGEVITDHISKADLRLSDIADTLQGDWVILAQNLGITDEEIIEIKKKYTTLSDQCLAMLILWKKKNGDDASGNVLEQALKDINREDVVRKTMYNLDNVNDAEERAFAKMQIEQSAGFDDLKDELGPSRNSTMDRNTQLDLHLDDKDNMKESESAGEESPSSPNSVMENRSFQKGPTADDQMTASYDEDRQVKPRSKEDQEEDDKKKQDAYMVLIDQLGGLPVDSGDDDVDLPGGPVVDEDAFSPVTHERDQPSVDFFTKLEHLDDHAPAPSMDDRMSVSSDEGKGTGPQFDQVAARLDQVVPDSSEPAQSSPYGQDYAAPPDTLEFGQTPATKDSPKISPSEPSEESIESLPSPDEEVEETRETLPDGTIIVKRVVSKGKCKTTYTSVLPQEPESAPEPKEMMSQGDDRPDEVEETENTMPDGSVVRTKIVKTNDTVYTHTTTTFPNGDSETTTDTSPRSPDSDHSGSVTPADEHPPMDTFDQIVPQVGDESESKPSVQFQDTDFPTSEPTREVQFAPESQPADYAEFPDLANSADQPDMGNIKIQTEVIKGKPKSETEVQEFEEELEDGTIVKRRITKTKTTQDVTTRIRAEGYGVDDLAVENMNEELANGSTIEGEPETDTNVEEYEDMLDDGTLVKRKVIKTKTTQSTTKKTVSDSSDMGAEEMDGSTHVHMKKKIHKKVVLDDDGTERTIIVEESHIKTAESGHEPELLSSQVASIMDEFLDKKGDFDPKS